MKTTATTQAWNDLYDYEATQRTLSNYALAAAVLFAATSLFLTLISVHLLLTIVLGVGTLAACVVCVVASTKASRAKARLLTGSL